MGGAGVWHRFRHTDLSRSGITGMSELLLTVWNEVFIPLWVWTILKHDWKREILVKNTDCVKLVMSTPRWSGGFWVLCPLSAHFPWSTHSFFHALLFMLHMKAGVSLFIIHVFFRTWRHLLTNKWCTQREMIVFQMEWTMSTSYFYIFILLEI